MRKHKFWELQVFHSDSIWKVAYKLQTGINLHPYTCDLNICFCFFHLLAKEDIFCNIRNSQTTKRDLLSQRNFCFEKKKGQVPIWLTSLRTGSLIQMESLGCYPHNSTPLRCITRASSCRFLTKLSSILPLLLTVDTNYAPNEWHLNSQTKVTWPVNQKFCRTIDYTKNNTLTEPIGTLQNYNQ